jgi:hypothetical protein
VHDTAGYPAFFYIHPESSSIASNAGYELLCFAQQYLKIGRYYYPALPLLSSIACNAAAMLQDSGRM